MSETNISIRPPSAIAADLPRPPWDTVCDYGNAIDSTESKDDDVSILRSDAETFLNALAPTGCVTFQTLPLNEKFKAKPGAGKWLNKILHGNLAWHFPELARLNKNGACIFVMPNEGDGKGRKAENVQSIRAVFVDLDGAPLEPVLAASATPSITVESSPGRYHAYWLVKDMPVKDFHQAQKTLAMKFNGDLSICDTPRLMRMPGFFHRKKGTSYRSRLLTCDPHCIYDWSTLANELELPTSMRLPEKIFEGTRNSILFKYALSASKSGIPESSRLPSLLVVNRERCEPPLSEAEVREIVASAYQYKSGGSLKIPIGLLTDERFVGLKDGSKLLLLLSYQRLTETNNGDIALLWKDFKHHFPREKTFGDLRKQIVSAGLLSLTRAPIPPRGVDKAKPGLYKFNILAGE